jgi:uncharacterized membrane protein required for colicin V production
MLGAITGSLLTGFKSGLIRRLAGMVFLGVAFIVGAQLSGLVGGLIQGFFPQVPKSYVNSMGYSVAFTGLLIGLNLLSGPILSRVAIKGPSRFLDQVLGAVFGAGEVILVISAVIVIVHTYTDPSNSLSAFTNLTVLSDIRKGIDGSTIGQALSKTTVPLLLTVMGPFLPTDIKQIIPIAFPGGLPSIPGFPTNGIPGIPTPTKAP